MKIKDKQSKVKVPDSSSYEFTHITFNFSFVTTNNDYCVDCLTTSEKSQLIKRIFEMSEPPYMELMLRDKKIGIETIDKSQLTIKASYNPKFDEDEFRKSNASKYAIARLHPNNQGIPCRIVGQLIDRVFYVLFFSRDHKLYK